VKRTSHTRVDVAGLEFDPITQQEILEDISEHLGGKSSYSFTVYKPYVEFFTSAWADAELMELLHRADRVVADGVAVQWAASYLAGPRGFGHWLKSLCFDIQKPQWRSQIIPERGAGVDATQRLLKKAVRAGWTVGIFGGPRDTKRTSKAIQRLFPGVKLTGVWSGFYDNEEEQKIISEIKHAYPDILFVAQGFPRQERLIDTYKNSKLARVLIGEGGTFDFDSMGGELKRAPKWMRKLGLEWLWRLVLQPNRWRRQLALPRFMWRIYKIGQQK
jgi:N-acetylglucosaminyldiphosphoundecaprenol N-acetyl-beta-D-mannosaminyltransferase